MARPNRQIRACRERTEPRHRMTVSNACVGSSTAATRRRFDPSIEVETSTESPVIGNCHAPLTRASFTPMARVAGPSRRQGAKQMGNHDLPPSPALVVEARLPIRALRSEPGRSRSLNQRGF